MLRGIESVAMESGYQVLLGDALNNVDRESGYLNILQQKKADGMILLTARIDGQVVEDIAKQFPVVLACEYTEGFEIPTVSIDNISSARKATEHLINLDHKRIGFLSGPFNSVLGRDRLKGYNQAMAQHSLPILSTMVQEGDFSYESGFNLTLKLLANEVPPTAISLLMMKWQSGR